MKNRAIVIAIAGLAVATTAWAVFRPELLFIDRSVNETFPSGAPAAAAATSTASSPRVLSTGMFHGVAHETKGTATIHELDGGKRVLRLTDFETSNGPDVRVLLIAAADASDNDTVKAATPIELAPLKGNVGDQNYDLPAGVDLGKYRAVTIWCNRFGVNFGTAALR